MSLACGKTTTAQIDACTNQVEPCAALQLLDATPSLGPVDGIEIAVSGPGGQRGPVQFNPPIAALPDAVAVLLPAAGGQFSISAGAVHGGLLIGLGIAQVTIGANQQTTTSATITLAPVCNGLACALGEACVLNDDCASSICDAETLHCLAAVGQACTSNGQCESGFCNEGTSKCVASACQDGIKDDGETGVDCGGPCDVLSPPQRCSAGVSCMNNSDCITELCSGAGACGKSTAGGPCAANSDCATGSCNDAVCSQSGLGGVCASTADCSAGACGTDDHCDAIPPSPTITLVGTGNCSGAICATENSQGLTASVMAQSGHSYAWTITDGSFTGGATGATVTFSAGVASSSPLTLACIDTSAAGVASHPASASIELLQAPQAPVINVASNATVGVATSASVTARPGFAYTWTVMGAAVSGSNLSGVTSGGTNTLTFTGATTGTSVTLACTEANALGATATSATSQVAVVPAPQITSFTSTPTVNYGSTATLLAVFQYGQGTVNQNVGAIQSSQSITTPVLYADETFTLTVTNVAGTTATLSTTVQVISGTFTELSGSPATPRSFPAFAPLPDGRILIVGGLSGTSSAPLASNAVDIFDPKAGTFTAGSPTAYNRVAASATLLPNGLVLVAGGETAQYNQYSPSNTFIGPTELFDYRTNSWSIGPSMKVPRSHHVAVPLPDGTVLFAGGDYYDGQPTATLTVETYSPWPANTFGAFTLQSATLNQIRLDSAAVPLADGRVLIAGGLIETNFSGGESNSSTAEIYDPVSKTLSGLINMPVAGYACSAAPLLNGKALLFFGETDDPGTPTTPDNTLDQMWLFDPSTAMFTATAAQVPERRYANSLTPLSDGRVLITGGCCGAGGSYPTDGQLYNPRTDSLRSAAGVLPNPGEFNYYGNNNIPPALWDGDVLLTLPESTNYAVQEPSSLFIPETYAPDLWAQSAGLSARTEHRVASLPDGTILLSGGLSSGGSNVATLELYQPTSNQFVALSPMAATRAGHSATALGNGLVLLAGGTTSAPSAELYDWLSGLTQNTTGAMTTVRINHVATRLGNGMVLLSGGEDGNGKTLQSAELYDPVAQTFTATAQMTVARINHTATLLPDGTVLLVGGSGAAQSSAEIFDPNAGTNGTFTSVVSSTFVPKERHAAVLLWNGKVLLAGGISGTQPTSEAEIYDPTLPGFEQLEGTALSAARADLVPVTTWNGKVLLIGGTGASGAVDDCDFFDAQSGQFTAAQSLTSARSADAIAAIPGGGVFVSGGVGSSAATYELHP